MKQARHFRHCRDAPIGALPSKCVCIVLARVRCADYLTQLPLEMACQCRSARMLLIVQATVAVTGRPCWPKSCICSTCKAQV